MVKIFKNFKEKKAFKPDFGAEGELHFLFCHDGMYNMCACLCVMLGILLSHRCLWWLLTRSEVKQRPGLLRLGERRTDPPYRDPTETCESCGYGSYVSSSRVYCLLIMSCLPVFRSSGLTLGSLCVSLPMSLSLCCATYQREWQRLRSPRKR